MKEHQPLGPRLAADVDRVAGARMAVVGNSPVVVGGEHRVVDDQVGPLAEANHTLAHLGQLLPVLGRQLRAWRRRPLDKLVLEQDVAEGRRVRDVDDRRAVGGQPISRGDVRVVEARAGDLHVGDLELGRVGQLAKGDLRPGLGERNGKVGILGLRGEHRLQVEVVALARVDRELVAALVKRREVRQPLDVIPVGMTNEQVNVGAPGLTLGKFLAEFADAGPGVDDDARSRGRAHLDARSVAAIALGFRPGNRQRPTHAPESNFHDGRRPPRARRNPNAHRLA